MPRSNSANNADVKTARAATSPSNELKFEAALAELEQIVQNMEGGQLPLEESLKSYRRGAELLRHCQQQLENAERQVQLLENGTLRDFEPDNGEAR